MAFYPKNSSKGSCIPNFLSKGIVTKKKFKGRYIYKIFFQSVLYTTFSLQGVAYKKILWQGVACKIFFNRPFFTTFSLKRRHIQNFFWMVRCIQHFLSRGVVYKIFLERTLYGRKLTFVHFHAVCRDILYIENHALSKKYF